MQQKAQIQSFIGQYESKILKSNLHRCFVVPDQNSVQDYREPGHLMSRWLSIIDGYQQQNEKLWGLKKTAREGKNAAFKGCHQLDLLSSLLFVVFFSSRNRPGCFGEHVFEAFKSIQKTFETKRKKWGGHKKAHRATSSPVTIYCLAQDAEWGWKHWLCIRFLC